MTRPISKTVVAVAACAVLGATAGIAGSAAAPSSQQSSTANSKTPAAHSGHADRFGRDRGVHSQSVVLNTAGTAFQTATRDEGTLKSLHGSNLTITEGTNNVTYKDATLTVSSDAKVLRNFKSAKLSELAAGDRVDVEQSPEGTFVRATDGAHIANDGDHADGRHDDGDHVTGRYDDGDNESR